MANRLDQPMVYQIRVKGHLGPQWTDWFGGLSITLEDNGDTLLTGPVVDRAALHGLLKKVCDLGMPLVSVIQVDPKQANGPDVNADTDHNRSKKETKHMNTNRQAAGIGGDKHPPTKRRAK